MESSLRPWRSLGSFMKVEWRVNSSVRRIRILADRSAGIKTASGPPVRKPASPGAKALPDHPFLSAADPFERGPTSPSSSHASATAREPTVGSSIR
jgi:hypothetical protein